jgi:hypothetical protein
VEFFDSLLTGAEKAACPTAPLQIDAVQIALIRRMGRDLARERIGVWMPAG